MIGFVRGYLYQLSDGLCMSVSNGIGHEIHTQVIGAEQGKPIWNDLNASPIDLWVHEHAPQDAPHELYGFQKREERDMFRRLLNIKGVGPKVAMRIVAHGWTNRDDTMTVGALCRIRGVGDTLAQRIIEEMT